MLVLGLLSGLANGYFVQLGLPPFVVTLAMLTTLRGIAFVVSDGYTTPVKDELVLWLGRGKIGPVHTPIVLAVIIAIIGWVVLSKTRFGLYSLAVGGREEAARAMGINVRGVKLSVYGGIGLLGALAGIVLTGRLGNGSPNAGIMLELEVIAATVLGGTSLFGGVATIAGTVAGALFINFVRNGLNLLGVNPFWVQVATGLILLLAVLLNTVVKPPGDGVGEGPPDGWTGRRAMTAPLVEMRNISKSFGAVVALRQVSLAVGAGEVVGLVGDNAAASRRS